MFANRTLSAVLVLSLGFFSCSKPTLRETFQASDAQRKALLLAVYSDLTPDQRKELLSHPGDPISLLQEWGVGSTGLWSDPKSFAPRTLVVETQAVTPVKTGRTLPLQAFLLHRDGKTRTDVTADVQWTAQPKLAWISGPGRLDYECLAQDVEVNADLLGERAAHIVIPFRKKITALSVEVAESSQVIEKSDYLQLKVLAYCEDGTQSEVTCQSSWKLPKGLGRVSACGSLQIFDREAFRTGEFDITTEYAKIQMTRRLHFRGVSR